MSDHQSTTDPLFPPGFFSALLFSGFILAFGFFLPLIVVVLKGLCTTDKSAVNHRSTEENLFAYHAKREQQFPERPAYSTVKLGEQLYTTYCQACHQEEGLGKVGYAPQIRNHDFLSLVSDDFIRRTILAGRPGTSMTPWAHLEEKQIEAIIAYLREMPPAPDQKLTKADPSKAYHGDADAGKGLYAVYCAACHGINGTGYAEGGSGPGIGNPGFLAVASDDYILQTLKHGRRGTPMRSFMGPGGIANLSEPEVGHIIAYLRSDRAPTVTVVASAEPDPAIGKMHYTANCAACHQPDGAGRPGVAPNIRNRNFLAIAGDDFIKETVRKGRPGTAMVQRPDLSDHALNNIIAYLRSVGDQNAPKVEVDPSMDLAARGNSTDGHQKFAVYCAACHGAEGKGYAVGGSGPAIGLTGFLSIASDDYIFKTLKHGRAGTAMRPFLGARGLANLNDQDAFDIIAYLRKLSPKKSVAAANQQ